MSAEQRAGDGTPSSVEWMQTQRLSRSGVAFEFQCSDSSVRADNSSPTEPPLHSRIERTQLRMRVEALEQALETSEHRRQAVIDRYEQLLADRAPSTDDASATEARSPLKRFLEAWQ